MEEVVNLIIPFIALAFLSVMIDKFTLFLEQIVNRIPKFPDKFEWYTAYALVLIMSTVVCWQGDFRFFDYLNLYFPQWLDYLMTGLVISGGSAFVRTQFGMIEAIPSAVMGVTGTFTRMLPGRKKKTTEETSNNINQNSYIPPVIPSNDYPIAEEYYPPAEEYYPPATEETKEVDYKDLDRFSNDI